MLINVADLLRKYSHINAAELVFAALVWVSYRSSGINKSGQRNRSSTRDQTYSDFRSSTPSHRQRGATNSSSMCDYSMGGRTIQQDNKMVILLMLESNTKQDSRTLKYLNILPVCQVNA